MNLILKCLVSGHGKDIALIVGNDGLSIKSETKSQNQELIDGPLDGSSGNSAKCLIKINYFLMNRKLLYNK